MQYRTFGKTMERVSSLGFGCMRLPVVGGDHSVIDEAPATRMIHHAIEQGVNYFDTAWPYHSISMSDSGSSEPFLGRALAGGKRELVNVATKFPSWLLREPGDFDTYLNAQLRRLQTDHIDFYLIHAIGATSWPTLKRLEAGAFLERARKDGRIRFRGFSYHDTGELFMEVVDHFDWDFCLLQYNYLDVNYQAGRRGLQRAQEKGMGIAIMEPLRGGYLARPLIPEAQAILDTAPTKRSNAEWAFRWLFNDPGIHVVLSGMNDQSQVEENLRIAREGLPHSLSEEETNIIARVQSAFRLSAEVPCTACRYCMPCPEGVEIPKNLLLLNDHHHLPAESRDALFRMRYGMRVTSEQSAARCTGCGACLSKCPQDIDIPSLMREILRLTT